MLLAKMVAAFGKLEVRMKVKTKVIVVIIAVAGYMVFGSSVKDNAEKTTKSVIELQQERLDALNNL